MKQLKMNLVTYEITPLSSMSGYIELLNQFSSLDQIGDRTQNFLIDYFGQYLAHDAREIFRKSTVSYSVAGYLLQFKDRHNGNIMLNNQGQIAHIDFGFFFESAPGGAFSIERSPFKMSEQFLQIIGGKDSIGYEQFKHEFRQEMIKCQFLKSQLVKMFNLILGLIPGVKSYEGIHKFQNRFTDNVQHCEKLVEDSISSFGSGLYDAFQALQNDINW
uniref:Phosphatidylinositol 4-kinase, putative n=1 Tax=Trepomonas sp. PC1 TaxID=1076344 RepID=A0A146K8D7_9EUKA|eukprot:JAP92204.1 Phosphatidylinositol 4-kinase, putative [Trepomonas sp. PC1]